MQQGDAVFHTAPLRRLTGFARPAHSPPSHVPCAPRPLRSRAFWRGSPAGMRDCVLVRAVATITLWVTASVRGSKPPVDLTRLGRGFSSRLAAQLLIRAELDRSRHRPEELVISACRPRCRVRGAGGTSCHRPFPGRPGLSQPCSRRTVSGRRASRRHNIGRSRFRGLCAPRRHSTRHALISVSWRDRPGRCRLGSFE